MRQNRIAISYPHFMAVTGLEFLVYSSLKAHGVLPVRPRVLELGESNWYGDVPTADLRRAIEQDATAVERRHERLKRLDEAAGPPLQLYPLARLFFDAIFDPIEYVAVDPGNAGNAHSLDLNLPFELGPPFDVTMNIGTAEHVFNVLQFFKSAHDHTAAGGIMAHTSPFTGWPDHGFYCFQPTFYFDLARANGYEILSFVIAQFQPLQYVQISKHDDVVEMIRSNRLPRSSHLNVVFRKAAVSAEFKSPMQGYYAGNLSAAGNDAWKNMR